MPGTDLGVANIQQKAAVNFGQKLRDKPGIGGDGAGRSAVGKVQIFKDQIPIETGLDLEGVSCQVVINKMVGIFAVKASDGGKVREG